MLWSSSIDMRKLDRLRWIAMTFGYEFVLPHRVAYDPYTVRIALDEFRRSGHEPSLRTDYREGTTQGFVLPFVYPSATYEAFLRIWNEWGERLEYIITEGVGPTETRCNVSVQRLSQTSFLVEWDNGGCAQRAWEHVCMTLEHAFVEASDDFDHDAHFALDPTCDGHYPIDPALGPLRTLRPRQLPSRTSFERMVGRIVALPMSVDPLTVYTVRQDGKIVIW